MKPIIEDDVLFHNLNNDEFEFIISDSIIVEVYKDNEFIGNLLPHFDKEAQESLIEEDIPISFENTRYIYINNELIYLDNLFNLSFY